MSEKTKFQQVDVNIDELKTFLTYIIKNNRVLEEEGKNKISVNIVGHSGIGKTSALLQLGQELGMEVVKLNLAQLEEVGDLVGSPVRQFQLCKEGGSSPVKKKKLIDSPKVIKVMEQVEETVMEPRLVKSQVMEGGILVMKDVKKMVPVKKMVEKEIEKTVMEQIEVEDVTDAWVSDGSCLWIDEPAVQEYIKRGYRFTGEKRMTYAAPEWTIGKEGGCILLLDDFNRAETRFLQAVMEIVDRGEYISWKLPKDCHVMLSSNPDDSDYFVHAQDNAQKTRYINVNLKADVEIWARWAEKQKLDTRCINFLLLHPELVTVEVNPRSVTNFFNSLISISEFSKELPLIQMIGEGSVGPEFSMLFTTFINNRLDKLVTPKDMLLHDNEKFILGELRNCIGKDSEYRADIASVLATRLINYTLHYAENNTITQKHIDRLITFMTDPETFTDDLKYVLVKKILNGSKQKFQRLMLDQNVIKMSIK